jgi:YbbR domain-containing protein
MRIFGNLGYKALAVVIALFLWVVARGSSSVERGFDIPVVLEGVPDELVVVDRGADVVNVRLLGTRAAPRNFDPQRLEYPLEISEAKAGQADFEVDLSRFDLPRGARVVSRSPSRIELSFEKRAGKTVKVKPDVEGVPADGYKLGRVSVTPPRVRITGARSEVLRLSEVATETIDVAGATEPVEREVRIAAGPGHVWADSPQTVKVAVGIEAERTPLAPTPPPAAGEAEKQKPAESKKPGKS